MPLPIPSPQPPTGPTPATTPSGPVTVSGTVFDYAGGEPRPLPAFPLSVFVLERFDELSGWRAEYRELKSDAAGRYVLVLEPRSSVSIAPALGSGFHAPCPNGYSYLNASRTLDAYFVPAAVLAMTGAPPNLPRLGSIWVEGAVFERTAEGANPVAGASVTLEGGADPRDGSTTVTNANGHYLICPRFPGGGTDIHVSLDIRKAGYRPARATAVLGWDYWMEDIDLVRE